MAPVHVDGFVCVCLPGLEASRAPVPEDVAHVSSPAVAHVSAVNTAVTTLRAFADAEATRAATTKTALHAVEARSILEVACIPSAQGSLHRCASPPQ